MDTKRTCPGCQKPLAPNAPDGLCPACLMKAGLGTGVDIGADSQAESGRTPFVVPTPAEVARLFPQLEILGFIGQGGMGAVYKARQKELDRVVALKILPPGIGTDPAFAERFTREAKALAKLNHPGIVTLYEFGKTDGLFFFLMEFVDGMSLRHLLEVERISAREALAIVPQICDALQYAHDQGIVHRDIKPENILLDRQGRVKVADFGLAKLAEIDAGAVPHTPALSPCGCERNAVLTKAGKVMGTPQYMAPEQREHPTEVDHRADIYSLGVVFYQMLTGELPGKPIEAPSHKVQIDLRLDEVVLRALEKEPERRYQQASQVKSDVETIATEAQPAARSQHSLFVHREGRRQIHLPGVVLTVSSAGLILIGSVLLIGLGLWISSAPIRLAFSSIALFLLLYLAVVCAIMHAAARRVAKASSAGRPPSEAAPLWRRAVLIEALWALGAGILALLVVVGMVMIFGGFSKGGGPGIETGSHREKGQERAPVTTPETHSAVRVYTVNKKVSEFPAAEDLSTPEAAYATFNRLAASPDNAGWRRLSTKRVAERIPADSRKAELPANYARALLSAEILEVFVFEERLAKVCALMPPLGKAVEEGIDTRALELQDGVWKNAGNEVVGSLEEARGRFDRWLAWERAERKSRERPPVADPEIHLRPFVEFLRRESADPREFVLRALARHLVVILGEVHNRPRYWAFNKALVRSPDFAREAGVIYLEFPFTDQPLMDRFLAAPTNDPLPVVEMLRNMFEMGWPDQPTVEFCQAVWEVNQSLPRERRLRIVLVDMARPWMEIQKREDWRKYNMDRDRLMADNIVRDLKEHADDPRHALFITGWMHAVKKVTMPDGEPILRSAAWHLSGGMGISEVFTVFPHCPVMANQGEVGGRIALGLFESAFAALTNRPIAFPLDHGPFGREVFDAALGYVTGDSFSAGFDAYLYLGRLEDEIMSPLVPGFYSDEYASEVDRRLRMLKGGGLAQADGKSLEALRAQWWGQPRYAWRNLGPLDAWHYGGGWEEKFREAKHRDALQEAPAIKEAARRLVDAIRKADYVNPGDWELFPAPNAGYRVATDYPGWMNWICRRFRENPIVQVELGEVTLLPDGRPQLPYVLTLKDGAKLEGSLPFEWSARGQGWIGVEGLDWHRGQPSD